MRDYLLLCMKRFSYNELVVLDFQYDIMPNYWGFSLLHCFVNYIAHTDACKFVQY